MFFSEPDDLHSVVKRVSLAVASALLPHFSQLIEANLKTVGVRFTLGADMVRCASLVNGNLQVGLVFFEIFERK